MPVVKPTIGRKVWYRASLEDVSEPYKVHQILDPETQQPQPNDASVCAVNADGTINLTLFDALGVLHPRANIRLLQDGETPPPVGPSGYPDTPYAEWMPYQKSQAAKNEAPPTGDLSTSA